MGDFRREVLPPRQGRGLVAPLVVLSSTLMITLSMAMVTAIPRSHPPPRRTRVVPTAVVPQAPRLHHTPTAAPADTACRGPIYRQRADGMTDATFELCARPPR